MLKKIHLYFSIVVLFGSSCSNEQKGDSISKIDERPNILLILADDMGFSDLGCYGSEIPTPNLDKLAQDGLRFTKFYNAGRCCPSRASLLTGLYPHQVGMGHMSGGLTKNDTIIPEYQGFLNKKCLTIAELLKSSEYQTMHSGKWHLGNHEDHWPGKRGFDHYFSYIQGAGSYFNLDPFWNKDQKTDITLNGEIYLPPKDDFYLTNAITEHAYKFLKEKKKKQPFFLYLAYTAPHWPLHALKEDIEKFRGKYLNGWDEIRQKRLNNLKKIGLVDESEEMSPGFEYNEGYTPTWASLSEDEKDTWDLRMAVYAAMIYRMDAGIGKLVNHLKDEGELENTLIIFLSDNGACHEPLYEWDVVYPRTGEIGSENSFDAYGFPWANASNTPFRLFKHWTMEGGIRTPFIAHWPKGIKKGEVNKNYTGHIIDIMATCLEISGSKYPKKFKNHSILPLEGQSLMPIFKGEKRMESRTLYWEHEGNRAILQDDWKLVYTRRVKGEFFNKWQLYNLSKDYAEMNDLAELHLDRKQFLQEKYEQWAIKVGVENWDLITHWE